MVVFSTIIPFKQTQTVLLTSLNFSTTFTQCVAFCTFVGIFLTLDDIRNLFRDYDYQLKTYRHHNCWRSRSIELIKKMVTHMELEKTGEDIEIDQAPPIRLLTIINGKEKDEFDEPKNYLPETVQKKNEEIIVSSLKATL